MSRCTEVFASSLKIIILHDTFFPLYWEEHSVTVHNPDIFLQGKNSRSFGKPKPKTNLQKHWCPWRSSIPGECRLSLKNPLLYIRTTATPLSHFPWVPCHTFTAISPSFFIHLLCICFLFVFSVTLWSVWYYQALTSDLNVSGYATSAVFLWTQCLSQVKHSACNIKISIASKFGSMRPSVSIVIATCYHGGSTSCLPILNTVFFCDKVGIRELVLSMCMLNIGSTALQLYSCYLSFL